MRGTHDSGEEFLVRARACHQRGNLLLLNHLPIDKMLNIRVVNIDNHHLGRPSGCAPGLDRASGPIPDFQERHETGGTTTARQAFALSAKGGKVGTGARSIFKQPRFPDPQIHDAVFVDEIIFHALNEAGMRLRVGIG